MQGYNSYPFLPFNVFKNGIQNTSIGIEEMLIRNKID